MTITTDGGRSKFHNRGIHKNQPHEWSEAAIGIKRVTPDGLVFLVIHCSQALQGCQDLLVRVQRVDDRMSHAQLGKNSNILVQRSLRPEP